MRQDHTDTDTEPRFVRRQRVFISTIYFLISLIADKAEKSVTENSDDYFARIASVSNLNRCTDKYDM